MMDAVPRSTPSPVSSVYNQHQRQPTYSSLLATITGSAVNSSTEQILTERVLCIRHCCGQRETAQIKTDKTLTSWLLHRGEEETLQINKTLTCFCEYLSTRMCVCVCVCMRAQSRQSCPTLCNPMDCSPQGSSVHGTLQTRTLE